MTNYRYIFGTLRDEKILAEIPLQGVYMDLELNAGGRFDGTLSLDRTGFDNETVVNATEPGRTFVVVERDGIPVWGGFVWSRVYQSQAKVLQLFAQSFDKYPNYQLVRSTFNQTGEQLTLFKDLWTHMQSVLGRNININVPPGTSPTIITKTVNVVSTDFKFYGEIISNLADGEDGFDWTVGVGRTGNQYVKTLRMGYPTLGLSNPSLITFEYPGSILNYYATESMATAGTNVFSLGAGEGSSMIFHQSTQGTMIDNGFPRWDVTVAHKDIDTTAKITSIGGQEKKKRKPPQLTIKPSMKANLTPTFGSFGLGDACTVILKDARFPLGKQFVGRIVKWELHPQTSENTEEYNLLFEGDDGGGE